MIRSAIHACGAFGLVLWMASCACAGMIYLTNSLPDSTFSTARTLPVWCEDPVIDLRGHATTTRNVIDTMALSVDTFPEGQLTHYPMNLTNTLGDTASFFADSEGEFDVFARFEQIAFHESLTDTGLTPLTSELISQAMRPTIPVLQIGVSVPSMALAQESHDDLPSPLGLETDFNGDSRYAQQLTTSPFNDDTASVVNRIPPESLPWKDEIPIHESQVPRDAMLAATGSELISRSLKESGNHQSSRASGDEEPPPRRNHLVQD